MFDDCKILDLSHPLTVNMPTWEGVPSFSCEACSTYEEGFLLHKFALRAGVGTHMDTPAHFVQGGKHVGQFPIEQLIFPTFVLNVSEDADENYILTVEALETFEEAFGEISDGSLFVLATGWDKYWTNPDKYRGEDSDGGLHFPSFSIEAAKYLVSKNVAGIGMDMLSPECQNKDFDIHHIILGAGKIIVENLTGLVNLPPRGSMTGIFPMFVEGASEAPVRAVGFIPKVPG